MALSNLDQIIAASYARQAQLIQQDRLFQQQLQQRRSEILGQQLQRIIAEKKRESDKRKATRKRLSTTIGTSVGGALAGGWIGGAIGTAAGVAAGTASGAGAGTAAGAGTGAAVGAGAGTAAGTAAGAIPFSIFPAAVAPVLPAVAAGGAVGGAAIGGAAGAPFSLFPAGAGPVLPTAGSSLTSSLIGTAPVAGQLAAMQAANPITETALAATSAEGAFAPSGFKGFLKGLNVLNPPSEAALQSIGMTFDEWIMRVALGQQLGNLGGELVGDQF